MKLLLSAASKPLIATSFAASSLSLDMSPAAHTPSAAAVGSFAPVTDAHLASPSIHGSTPTSFPAQDVSMVNEYTDNGWTALGLSQKALEDIRKTAEEYSRSMIPHTFHAKHHLPTSHVGASSAAALKPSVDSVAGNVNTLSFTPTSSTDADHVSERVSTSFLESCSKSLKDLTSKAFDYVCDSTVPWLHYTKDSGTWAPATPPAGTGCHSYVYVQGKPPPDCSVGHACSACAAPDGNVVHTAHIEGGSCAPCPATAMDFI